MREGNISPCLIKLSFMDRCLESCKLKENGDELKKMWFVVQIGVSVNILWRLSFSFTEQKFYRLNDVVEKSRDGSFSEHYSAQSSCRRLKKRCSLTNESWLKIFWSLQLHFIASGWWRLVSITSCKLWGHLELNVRYIYLGKLLFPKSRMKFYTY